jgi:hypothetical protein
MRIIGCVRQVSLFSVGLIVLALPTWAAEPSLPWSFVNGSAKGYSIQLVSADPAPGTPVAVGQTVEFKITVSYQLSIADKGSILLVVQDETNRNLLGDRKQQSQSVDRGKGSVTLTDSFVVSAGNNEILLFIPLVPSGISHTSGELVVRYPVKPVGQPEMPTVESIRELLAISKFDAILAELEKRQRDYIRTQLEQDAAKEMLNAKQQALRNEYNVKALSMVDDVLRWTRVEVMLVSAFQDSYSQLDVDALIAFYRSDSGRAVLAKVPQAVQVFTAERITEWDSIRDSQGEKAVEERIKEEVGVVFKPSEVDGFCAFYASPTGKDITARMPRLRKQLEESVRGLEDDAIQRMQALATDYQAQIQAAGAVK